LRGSAIRGQKRDHDHPSNRPADPHFILPSTAIRVAGAKADHLCSVLFCRQLQLQKPYSRNFRVAGNRWRLRADVDDHSAIIGLAQRLPDHLQHNRHRNCANNDENDRSGSLRGNPLGKLLGFIRLVWFDRQIALQDWRV
jgi:hypothetical protein